MALPVLGRRSGRGGSIRRGISARGVGLRGRVNAGLRRRARVNFFRQGMRAQAEFHQGFCFGQPRAGKTVVGLIAPHRLTRRVVPFARGFLLEVSRLNQAPLNLFHALRLEAEVRQASCARPASAFLGAQSPRGGLGGFPCWPLDGRGLLRRFLRRRALPLDLRRQRKRKGPEHSEQQGYPAAMSLTAGGQGARSSILRGDGRRGIES